MPGCISSQQVKPINTKGDYAILERIVDIQVDKLQNIYILNKENKVVKYSDSFEKQYEYSNNLIGEIKSIDATNPQKILCFIQDFNRILVLDNTLAEINIIDLSTSEYLDVSVVARTNDDQIWLFDPINQVLVKVNDLIEKQFESNRLTDLNLGIIDPVELIERGNIVAMSDPEIGILIFDNFGQFLRLIPEKGLQKFQIFGDYLFFTQNMKYYQYHTKRYEKSEFPNMLNGFAQFISTKHSMYYIDENGVVIKKNN
jgi:hypothetical protein